MTLAPGTGNVLRADSEADLGPMHFIGFETSLSQPSSWEESCVLEDEYHEPAWLGWRTFDMLKLAGFEPREQP